MGPFNEPPNGSPPGGGSRLVPGLAPHDAEPLGPATALLRCSSGGETRGPNKPSNTRFSLAKSSVLYVKTVVCPWVWGSLGCITIVVVHIEPSCHIMLFKKLTSIMSNLKLLFCLWRGSWPFPCGPFGHRSNHDARLRAEPFVLGRWPLDKFNAFTIPMCVFVGLSVFLRLQLLYCSNML